MSLESWRNRLRAIEAAARERATSAECTGTTDPVLIQVAVRLPVAGSCEHPGEEKPQDIGTDLRLRLHRA
jgi:hypothetical protein